ncbi:protein of unknown function [Streptomyces sp. KY75]|nr:protein of unknown function [Streptomyces sp. KY70]CAD5988561.1 protein of unknown function [Streptomyces sp. KY75]
MDLKLYIGEYLDGTESLGDPSQRQHGRSGHVNHLLRRLTGGGCRARGKARRSSRRKEKGGKRSVRRPAR